MNFTVEFCKEVRGEYFMKLVHNTVSDDIFGTKTKKTFYKWGTKSITEGETISFDPSKYEQYNKVVEIATPEGVVERTLTVLGRLL